MTLRMNRSSGLYSFWDGSWLPHKGILFIRALVGLGEEHDKISRRK